jgi:AGCS family alanine or glycine:cation symporter
MSNHWIWVLGFLSAILISVVLTGGAKRITAIAELLVPVVSAAYILLCVGVLAARWREIDNTIITIVRGAFSPIAITGGAVGSIFQTVRVGIARGVFTNEAGLGTAGIAHGSTKVEHPAMQGVLGIVEVFLDTIVICTLTAFVILCCDIPIAYGTDMGGELTTAAFISIWGKWIVIPLGLIIICLAVATIIGWGLYGLKGAQYIFGNQDGKMFVILQALAAFAGAVTQSSKIWLLAEVVNGLMMLPNLILLVHQSNIVKKLTQEYKGKLRKNKRAIFRKRNVLHKSFFRAAISDSESRRGV